MTPGIARRRIEIILDEIERTQAVLGPDYVVDPEDIAELRQIIARIERQLSCPIPPSRN